MSTSQDRTADGSDPVGLPGDVPRPPRMTPENLALFLDFDGCLVDIAQQPDAIAVPQGLADLLTRVQASVSQRLAIVTGRSVADFRTYVKGFDGPVYGSHGAELGLGDETLELAERPAIMDRLLETAHQFCSEHPGCRLEEKPLGFAIHYREAPAEAENVSRFVHEAASGVPEVRVQSAKMAFELKPAICDKGSALDDAMKRMDWVHATPVAIGDDVTDERAFAAAAEWGGYGIKVGEGETSASYRLDAPHDVHAFLTGITKG